MNQGSFFLRERMATHNVIGISLAVVNNYKISHTECFGLLEANSSKKVKTSSLFNACSVSKFLTSVLVMILVEKGNLDLDIDVNELLTSWKLPKKLFMNHKVTLRDLLSHQSGIVDPIGSFGHLDQIDTDPPSMVELLKGRTAYCKEPIQVKYKPGSDFQYSDAGFCTIEQIVEDVTGMNFNEVMNDFIFKPLNMSRSTTDFTRLTDFRGEIASGHLKTGEKVKENDTIYPYPAACGLWTTPTDLALIMVDLLKSMKNESRIGLSASSAMKIMSSYGDREWTGLGVFLEGSGRHCKVFSLGWGVGFQCMMALYPKLENGVIIMTNTDLGVHQDEGIIGDIIRSLTLE